MANKFVHAAARTVVIDLDGAEFLGEELIPVVSIPLRQCCLVFRNFEGRRAEPVGIFPMREAIRLASGEGDDFIKPLDVCVPIGLPNLKNEHTLTVLKQCARQWVSGGRNDVDLDITHMVPLFLESAQCVVDSLTKKPDLMVAFTALVRTLALCCHQFDFFRKTVATLAASFDTEVTQRALCETLQRNATTRQGDGLASQMDSTPPAYLLAESFLVGKEGGRTHPAVVRNLTEATAFVQLRNLSKWGGIQFALPGKYTITPTNRGMGLILDQEWRLTVGPLGPMANVMCDLADPDCRWSYSSADETPVEAVGLEEPFTVTVSRGERTVTLAKADRVHASFPLAEDEAPLIGFKYVDLVIAFEPR